MLTKIFALILLGIGSIMVVGFVLGLIGIVGGLLVLALKLAIPVALIYFGYRLLTRDQHIVY